MSGQNVGSPSKPHGFLIPSPVPCRRTRTKSMSERAAEGPTHSGSVHSFCREKGHGFIKPDDDEKLVFVHISDIEAEYVLKEGDRVTFKLILLPPKNEKMQAVHVQMTHLNSGVPHERWDSPLATTPPEKRF